MQPAPALRQQHAPAARRVEDAPVHAGRLPALLPRRPGRRRCRSRRRRRARDAARGGALERLGDGQRRAGELEDVGLEQHLGARARRSPRPAPANSAAPPFSSSADGPAARRASRTGGAFDARHRSRPAPRSVELELGDQRQVVRHARPGGAARHARSTGSEAARVDAVHREQRQARREGVVARRRVARHDRAVQAAVASSAGRACRPSR